MSSIGLKMKYDSNYEGCERPIDVGWVGSWASNFQHLLSDQVGLKIYSVKLFTIKNKTL